MVLSVPGGSQWLKRILVQCQSQQLLQLRDDVGSELNRKTVVLLSQLARLGSEIAPSRGRGSSLKGKRYRPNIATVRATSGLTGLDLH